MMKLLATLTAIGALSVCASTAQAQTAFRERLAQAAFENGLPAVSADVDQRQAAIAYSRAQHGGRIAPGQLPASWSIRAEAFDAAAAFDQAQTSNRLDQWLDAQAPADARYAALAPMFARYRTIATLGGWSALEIGAPLRLGSLGDRVVALRTRLAFEDATISVDGELYDSELAAAVERSQARLGLTVDGVAGPKTLAALNVTAQQRVDQILANMERWRWMPRDLPPRRIEVNTAAATLAVYNGGQLVATTRIIAGKPQTPTPMFSDRITGIVFNPPWNVPAKIAAEEIWPKIRKDPDYMREQGFVVTADGGLRQAPGPRAALGAYKFEMGNRFGVYLHDTPNRGFFAWDYRHLSHGCMRVENPRQLADLLLEGDPLWTGPTIDASLSTGITIRASLRRPIALYVAHWTAFVDAAGTMQFRDDVYGWDAALVRLLDASASDR